MSWLTLITVSELHNISAPSPGMRQTAHRGDTTSVTQTSGIGDAHPPPQDTSAHSGRYFQEVSGKSTGQSRWQWVSMGLVFIFSWVDRVQASTFPVLALPSIPWKVIHYISNSDRFQMLRALKNPILPGHGVSPLLLSASPSWLICRVRWQPLSTAFLSCQLEKALI